jgi:hypothetical protein
MKPRHPRSNPRRRDRGLRDSRHAHRTQRFARRDLHGWLELNTALEPTQRGARFRFRVYGQPTGVMRLAEPILSRILKRRFAGYCTTLKSVLENALPQGMTRARRSRLQA